jgi:predicted MPP superfamily phosphohydrolase
MRFERTWAALVRWFFFNFFRLLLLAVSVSQWVVLWWLSGAFVAYPWYVHAVAPVVIYAVNRRLVTRGSQRRGARHVETALPRLYYAAAFTALFCSVFLLLTAALWVTTKIVLGTLVAQAGTGSGLAPAVAGLDTGFRWLANLGVAGIVALLGYGYSAGQRQLAVTVHRLRLRNVPPTWHGLRIAQISDIHVGRNLDRAQLERFVERVNGVSADLICVTGDIADSAEADLDGFLPILAGLRATHGVIAILGNHDHYAGAEFVEDALRRHTDWTVLRDARTTLAVRGHPLHVLGLDDRGRDWARGVASVPVLDELLGHVPVQAPTLLLCHRPDIFSQAAARGIGLTLSGHTHGGQLGIPWFGGRTRNLAQFVTHFDRGLFVNSGSFLYVNSGLGVTGQRIRLWTPREISVIEIDGGARRRAA